MKNLSVFSQITMAISFTVAPICAFAGGAGPGGGGPLLLAAKNVNAEIRKFSETNPALEKMITQNTLIGFAGDCKITGFTAQSSKPQRLWYITLKNGRTIVDPQLFKESQKKQINVVTALAEGKDSPAENLNVYDLPKKGEVANAIASIRAELKNSKLFEAWIKDTFYLELDQTRFYTISEKCFVNANNQSDSLLEKGKIVSVRGFTQTTAFADIYFSSEVSTYQELGLKHIIAAELGHHLPIGPEASNETTVDALAAVIALGSDSIDSKAIMFNLAGKLLIHRILAKANIQVPDITTSVHKEDLTPITGPTPLVIENLRNFLKSDELALAAQDVFNGFNNLWGEVKFVTLRDCDMSYWLYAGVSYDQMVKKTFEKRAPTEMEEVLLNLSQLDRHFCPAVNHVFGKTFIEYGGYGTSYLSSAERDCLLRETKPEKPYIVTGQSISNQKRNELMNLNQKIEAFKDLLCPAVKKFYSWGLPFRGTVQERQLILAVIGEDVSAVESLLKAGVSPHIRDSRETIDSDYHRGKNFSVYYHSYSYNKSLISLSRDKNIENLLIQYGAEPESR